MKQKTRILIYILIAIAAVILGTIAILSNHNSDKPATAEEHLDLGRIYLNELSYENAVLEFNEAIEIEPLNADAYLGLAEAYAGMGDIPKAVEALERGIEKTGDERLRKMLEELQPPEETTAETEIETTTTTVPPEPAVDFITIRGVQYSTSLTELELIGMDLTNEDIKDLDKMVNLTSLFLSNNFHLNDNASYYSINEIQNGSITDISVLKRLTKLKYLDLSFNQVTNIGALEDLTNLTDLSLYHNSISDISVLKNLTNLTSLGFGGSQISDISVLKNLTNLTFLGISDSQISDISVLKYLTNLTDLSICSNQISDISVLRNLTNLTHLYFSINQISDTSALKDLNNLTILWLNDNQISDISALGNLTNLTFLELSGNQISDISALKKLTNLTTLRIYVNPIREDDINELRMTLPDCEIVYF